MARNGGSYKSATPFSYVGGSIYHLRLVINVASHTYSVYVKPLGGSETLIGSNYAFRTEQASVSSLDTWVVHADSGSLKVCNVQIE